MIVRRPDARHAEDRPSYEAQRAAWRAVGVGVGFILTVLAVMSIWAGPAS